MKQRIGRFSVSWGASQAMPEHLKKFFSEAIIVKAESAILGHFYVDRMDYTAIHPDFDEITEGDSIPKYLLEYRKEENGEIIQLPLERI